MNKEEILKKIKEILTDNKLSISTGESCTGGLISSHLTDIAGSSSFVFQNFVTYSNAAKQKFLKVQKETLDKFGAVSFQTAYEMSSGLLDFADTSIASTGILGPTGGSLEKPVGLVYISFGYKKNNEKNIEVLKYISKERETNDRLKIKQDIVLYALENYVNFLEKHFGK